MLICLFVFIIIINCNITAAFHTEMPPRQGWRVAARSSPWEYSKDVADIEPRRRRESYITCSQSPILYNTTLKGGIEAGYFRKLAEHVAMQLCVELCCQDKGCDVAFMSGKNCYGIQCFNQELCTSLPTTQKSLQPLLIAHVTFKGEKVIPKVETKEKLRCVSTHLRAGATLRGGLEAGNFTDVGVVQDPRVCVSLCCDSATRCDVAMLINNHCFLVTCRTLSLCKMTKSLTPLYKSSLAYVRKKEVPNLREDGVHNKTSVATEPGYSSEKSPTQQLVCKNSEIFYNSTLKGGYQAGNYTNVGLVTNINTCIRHCCGNRDCDAAFMLENNCFAVACHHPDDCLPVHAKSSSSSAALRPRITYITSRSEEVGALEDVPTGGICHAGIVSYDVTLRGGSNAGKFTPHGVVNDMKTCVFKCCQSDDCNVAMMLKDSCFTVVCDSEEKCEKRPTPTSSHFNPRIAYVFRGRSHKSHRTARRKKKQRKMVKTVHNHDTMKYRKKMMLIEQLHALTSAYDASALQRQQQEQLQQQQQQQQQQQEQEEQQLAKQQEKQHKHQVQQQDHNQRNQEQEQRDQWSQKSLHQYKIPTTPRQKPLPLPGKDILHKNLFPTTISDSSSFTSTEGVYVLTTASPISSFHVSIRNPSAWNTTSGTSLPTFSPPLTLERKHRKFLEENSLQNNTHENTAGSLDPDSNDTFDYWATTKRMNVSNLTEKAKPVNATSDQRGKTNNSIPTTASTNHLLKHLLQRLNYTSPSHPPLYEFLLGNFQAANSRKSLPDSRQRVNASSLTKRQLMTLQLNKTLINMSTDFVQKPIANSFTFNRGKLTFHGDNKRIGENPRSRIPLANPRRTGNNTDVRFIIPLVSNDEPEESPSNDDNNHKDSNKNDNKNHTGSTWNKNSFLKTNNNDSLSDNSLNDGDLITDTLSSRSPITSQPPIATSSSIHSDMTVRTETPKDYSTGSYFSTPPTYIRNSSHNSTNSTRISSNTTSDFKYTLTALPSSSSTISPHISGGNDSNSMTSQDSASPDYISDALDSSQDSPYLTNVRVDGNGNCMRSKIFYNVTLRGGYDSGKFRDRGRMGNVVECAQLCCHLIRCDLVMMLQDRCFSVHCKNPHLCESIPARSPVFSPTVCYIRHI